MNWKMRAGAFEREYASLGKPPPSLQLVAAGAVFVVGKVTDSELALVAVTGIRAAVRNIR